ncbi:16414_t:CDS:2, partial [Cetraspora pellucida]
SEMNEKLDYISCKIQNEGVEYDNVQTNDMSHNDSFPVIETFSDLHLESKIDITKQSSIDDYGILGGEKSNNERSLSMPLVHSNWGKSDGPFSDTELDETRKPEKP